MYKHPLKLLIEVDKFSPPRFVIKQEKLSSALFSVTCSC